MGNTNNTDSERLISLFEGISKNFMDIASIMKNSSEQQATSHSVETNEKSLTKDETPKKSETARSESAEPPITIEQIRGVLAEKSQAGLTAKVKELLTSFGAAKLSGIDPTQYRELMAAAKELK